MKTTVIHNPKIDAAKADFVICHRVSDLPIPYTEGLIENCCKCGERMWVAFSSPKEPPRICFQCIGPIVAEEKKKGEEIQYLVTKKQIIDMAKKGWL